MIKILIVDDNAQKVKNIRQAIEKVTEVTQLDIETDLVNARRHLQANQYDLLILDLSIPNRMGDECNPENGLNFLSEINSSIRIVKPSMIIGLSAYSEYVQVYKERFLNELWALIEYKESSTDWERKIINKIDYIIQVKRALADSSNKGYEYDLAIITALRQTELESILNLNANWRVIPVSNDSTEYHAGVFTQGEKKLKVIAAACPQMGMVAASVLTMKLIHNFRPKYVAMTGIAAGIRGTSNFGDILVTESSFDSGSGKIKTNTAGESFLQPDYKQIDLDTDLKEKLIACKGNREFLDEIQNNWPADKPPHRLNIHLGPLASGAGVIENKKIVDDIKGHSRKLLGIDMETYGVYYAAKHSTKPRPHAFISLKSVTDFADPDKDDSYQRYAAYTSASFLYRFFLNKVDF
jgi:nucleoside phosphorylase/CheY-like chemotaxis protein